MRERLPTGTPPDARRAHWAQLLADLEAMLRGEDDWVAALATAACELHHAFRWHDWTGFYRAAPDGSLIVGPYQGGHGCLRIPKNRGVCGACARERRTLRVDDVELFPGHIACSSSTRSELVAPVLTPSGTLLAVLDIDSDREAAFDEIDVEGVEALASLLGSLFPERSHGL